MLLQFLRIKITEGQVGSRGGCGTNYPGLGLEHQVVLCMWWLKL